MNNFWTKYGYLSGLLILCIIALVFFTGHYSNLWLDVGREVYYPERILQGKILYKDLFVIYGPFAYLFNALLYKCFGANLTTLYVSGMMCSLGIVSAVYLIAGQFLSKFLSFALGIFVIATGVCAVSLFNFTFPYSWAMLYGTVFSLFSLLFLLKFIDLKEHKFLYLSAFLSGMAAVCKQDFWIFALIVLFVIFRTKKINIITNAIISFMVIPVMVVGILFWQGMNFNDIVSTIKILNAMTHTQSLNYFYKHSGVYFSIPILGYWIVNFVKAAVGFGTVFYGTYFYKRNREAGIVLTVAGIVLTYWMTNPAIFAFLTGGIIIFAICAYKKVRDVKMLILLIICTIALSLKSLWGLTPLNYGNYYCALVIAAFFAIFYNIFDKNLQKAAGIYILTVSLWFIIFNAKQLTALQGKITSENGTIYTSQTQAEVFNNTLDLMKRIPAQKVVTVFPEGLMLNFLSENKLASDDFYNSLLLLYIETFEEENIVEHFEKNKPDFILFTNLKMEDYASGYICRDYAKDFCGFVAKNYVPAKTIQNSLIVFSKK